MSADRPLRLVCYRELRERFGIDWTDRHLTREERAGRFPQSVRLGHSSKAWLEAEIVAWIEAKMAARVSPVLTSNQVDEPQPLKIRTLQ